MNNPILQEVRDNREKLAAEFDFDLHRIVEDALARQKGQVTVNRQTAVRKSVGVTRTTVPPRF